MSKTDSFENKTLLHTFQNADIALIGDATGLRGSTTAGNLYFSLHTADPGEGGDQTTSEATYTGYARVAVARTSGGFTVSGNALSNAAAVAFAACTAGSNTITHVGVGASSSGAGLLMYKGALSASLSVSNGITPEFAIGEFDLTES